MKTKKVHRFNFFAFLRSRGLKVGPGDSHDTGFVTAISCTLSLIAALALSWVSNEIIDRLYQQDSIWFLIQLTVFLTLTCLLVHFIRRRLEMRKKRLGKNN